MPTMIREEIVKALSDGRIRAMSLDTTVFDSKQKNFRQAELRAVSQFRVRGFPMVLPDVIASEMKAHLAHEASETQRELKKTLRAHNLRWHRDQPPNEATILFLDRDPTEYAQSEFDDFATHVGARILDVAEKPDVLSELFRRYFSLEAPFGIADARKAEFPDAAALLRLEAFAKEHNTIILCIAQDQAWKDFAEASENIATIFPLNAALGALSEAFRDEDLADEIIDLWLAGEQADFEAGIRDAIIDRLMDLDFEIEAESGVSFEAEPIDADLVEIFAGTLTEPVVLAADEETVTFTVGVMFKAKFEAIFSFSVWDSVDKEYVGMGTEVASTTETLTLPITIIADRDVSEGIHHHEISVSQKPFTVDFGYVEAFPVEEPDADF